MPTSPTGNQGRGETTGPAGSKADASSDASSVETSSSQTPMHAQDAQLSSAPSLSANMPVVYVIDYKKGKGKKKRKYSSGLKDVQNFERGASKAAQRLSRAVERGLSTYRKRRDKSSRKQKDGAIRDALENWSKGLGRSLRISSRAPSDLAKQINTKSFSRQLRNTIRIITPPLFR